MNIKRTEGKFMDLQEAYNLLLKDPDGVIQNEYQDGYALQYFEFVCPPSYTTAAQHNQKVMQSIAIWDADSNNPRPEEPKNHWGFLYPPTSIVSQ